MPPFRLPFSSKRPTINTDPAIDENARPTPNDANVASPYRDKPSLALGLKEKRIEPNEFKLSCMRPIRPRPVRTEANLSQRSTTAANIFR